MKITLKKLLAICLTAIILLNGTYIPDTPNLITPKSNELNIEKN